MPVTSIAGGKSLPTFHATLWTPVVQTVVRCGLVYGTKAAGPASALWSFVVV